ncbi:MAG: hypothetical protein ABIR80_05530, partial [Opitutaceae bacterium]
LLPSSAPASPTSAPAQKTDPARAPDTTDQRVALLKQLLTELPAQHLPELRLLDAADWLAIAQKHELDNAVDIRVALAELRAMARTKFGQELQSALKKFTDESGGELPTDLTQLAAYLVSPAADMLARYDLLRTGKLGDSSKPILREKATSDLIMSVGLDGLGLTNNSDLPAAFGETSTDTLNRAMRAIGTTLGDDPEEQSKIAATLTAFSTSAASALESMGPGFGDEMKRTVAAFLAANPTETLTDVAQILPLLKESEKLVAVLRPVFAKAAYANEHDGQWPTSPEQLQPYLARPFSPAEAFRAMKLQGDGQRLDLDFDFPALSPVKP